ncbi:hypothetical protein [Oceaniradius stylonematis]|uniref:hypothetical protein n=1 Tax=Oceaniradius stylonematis TaxID=2184161 RepID=UPI00273DD7B5|nr:hypothetical protein [Oceaniradius stylonematis]MCR9196808.1 hypothetical protein [Hyphomonas sp.]
MHIQLDQWVDKLSEKTKTLQDMLPCANDEENLFLFELEIASLAYISRKIMENSNVFTCGSNIEATEIAKEQIISLHCAPRKTDTGIWQNVSVYDAYDLSKAPRFRVDKDLRFICDQIIHAVRFDTGTVPKIGMSILFSSDREWKKRIFIVNAEKFLEEFQKFQGRDFQYKNFTT